MHSLYSNNLSQVDYIYKKYTFKNNYIFKLTF